MKISGSVWSSGTCRGLYHSVGARKVLISEVLTVLEEWPQKLLALPRQQTKGAVVFPP